LIKGEADSTLLLFIAAIKGLFYVCLQDDKSKAEVEALVKDYVGVFCHGIEV
jgi:hypothetical protein